MLDGDNKTLRGYVSLDVILHLKLKIEAFFCSKRRGQTIKLFLKITHHGKINRYMHCIAQKF